MKPRWSIQHSHHVPCHITPDCQRGGNARSPTPTAESTWGCCAHSAITRMPNTPLFSPPSTTDTQRSLFKVYRAAPRVPLGSQSRDIQEQFTEIKQALFNFTEEKMTTSYQAFLSNWWYFYLSKAFIIHCLCILSMLQCDRWLQSWSTRIDGNLREGSWYIGEKEQKCHRVLSLRMI